METSMTVISIIAGFIAVLVAINFAYNFYSIFDFQKRLNKFEDKFENNFSKIQTDISAKIGEFEFEINKLQELNKGYVDIMYQVHSANASLSYNDKRYFEAIAHELRSIYHVTKNKSLYSDMKFKELIDVKYWFIAQDTLKYENDKYLCSGIDGDRNRALEARDDIIQLCKEIEQHPNSIYSREKIKIVRSIVPTLIDNLYNRKEFHSYGGDWDKIREMAK